MSITTLALLGLTVIVLVVLWVKIGKLATISLLVIAVIVLAICFTFVHSFQSLNQQTQAATVRCSSAANIPHTMLVDLNGQAYSLAGDRWMLQSSVIQVQPWLLFMGIKSGYTLDRLDSQFDDVNAHTVRPVELGGFSLYKITDLWRYFPLIKSAFGNGVIEPCDGRTYTVFVDVNGEMYAQRA